MTLRGWKYTPGKPDKRSPAQKAAHARAFQIFQLRGLYSLCYRLTAPRRAAVQAIIDDELAMLGAETEAKREADRRAKEEADWRDHVAAQADRVCPLAAEPDFEEIPF